MSNISINLGGIIGAIAGGIIVAVFVYGSAADGGSDERWRAKACILGVIGGAVLGNAVWSRLFRRAD